MITGADHVNLTIASRDLAAAFFCAAFGFKEERRFESDDPVQGVITGHPGSRVKVALLRLGTLRLGLVEFLGEHALPAAAPDIRRPGTPTLVFDTSDLDGDYARLRGMGVQFRSPPQHEAPFRVRICQGVAPGGALFSLVQRDA